jgi:hypothetical protein
MKAHEIREISAIHEEIETITSEIFNNFLAHCHDESGDSINYFPYYLLYNSPWK